MAIRKRNTASRRGSKNIGNMTFSQLVESITDDTTEGFDEFDEQDDDFESDDLEIDGLELDELDDESETVTISISKEHARALVDALQAVLDDETEETEVEGEDFEDEDFEDEDEDEDFVDEDEEVTIDGNSPTRKAGTPPFKRSKTVEKTTYKPSGSDKATPATVEGGSPTRKAGTPSFKRSKTVDGTRIAPTKRIDEV